MQTFITVADFSSDVALHCAAVLFSVFVIDADGERVLNDSDLLIKPVRYGVIHHHHPARQPAPILLLLCPELHLALCPAPALVLLSTNVITARLPTAEIITVEGLPRILFIEESSTRSRSESHRLPTSGRCALYRRPSNRCKDGGRGISLHTPHEPWTPRPVAHSSDESSGHPPETILQFSVEIVTPTVSSRLEN